MQKDVLRTALLFAAMGEALRPHQITTPFQGGRMCPTQVRRRKISKREQKKRARIHRLSVNRETR